MRVALILVVLVCALAVAYAQENGGADAEQPAGVSADLAQRLAIHRLETTLFTVERALGECRADRANLEAALAGQSLTTKRDELQGSQSSLEAELREALGAGPDDAIDWSTDPPSIAPKE